MKTSILSLHFLSNWILENYLEKTFLEHIEGTN